MGKTLNSWRESDGSCVILIGTSSGIEKIHNNAIVHYKITPPFTTSSSNVHPVSVAITGDKTHLCLSLSNKILFCWNSGSESSVGIFTAKKLVSSLVTYEAEAACKSKRHVIIYADKIGDVWGSVLPAFNSHVMLLGHTASVVTAMDVNADSTLLATADRDEKIRISSLPVTEKIAGYLLGHNSVVTSIQFFKYENVELLASVSWDHRLIIWIVDTFSIVAEFLFTSAASQQQRTTTAEETANDVDVDQQDEAEEEDGNQYDEVAAGDYPFALAADNSGNIGVIFRNSRKIAFLRLQRTDSLQVQLVTESVMPSSPVDICSLPGGRFAALFTGSDGLRCFDSDGVDATSDILNETTLEELRNTIGDSYSADTAHGRTMDGAERGFAKHKLEVRYADVKAQKAAKRSKKLE